MNHLFRGFSKGNNPNAIQWAVRLLLWLHDCRVRCRESERMSQIFFSLSSLYAVIPRVFVSWRLSWGVQFAKHWNDTAATYGTCTLRFLDPEFEQQEAPFAFVLDLENASLFSVTSSNTTFNLPLAVSSSHATWHDHPEKSLLHFATPQWSCRRKGC